MQLKIGLSSIVASLGTLITAWLGGWDAALQALMVFMVLDYSTGFLAAVWHHRVDSEVMYKGGIRKAVILVVIAISVICDHIAGNGAPIFRTLVVYYYTAREGLSVLENIGLLGVPLPHFLVKVLAQLQPEDDSNPPHRRTGT